VFTDKTLLHHYTRKWDLETSPSVCVHCAVGCNTLPGARYGELRRIRNRYHHEVNGYFLCDRGRFGYEFVNRPERLRAPLLRAQRDAAPAPVSRKAVLERLGELCRAPERLLGIGSPRASLESNFALRTLVGANRFCIGLPQRELRLLELALSILRDGPAKTPSLCEVESADCALVLGEDITSVAPRLALALRQLVRQEPMEIADQLGIPRWNDGAVREAVQRDLGPLFIAASYETRLDELARETYRAAPDELARLGFAVAQEIDPAAPKIDVGPGVRALALRIAERLLLAKRSIIVAGTTSGSEPLLHAAANVAGALVRRGHDAKLALTLPECNSLGLALQGGLSLEAALAILRAGSADTLVVVENDLFERLEDARAIELLDAAPHLVVLDHLPTETALRAEMILPAATFAESSGTLVSSEGRAQRFFDTLAPAAEIRPSWRWLDEILVAAGRPERFADLDSVLAALARELPALAPVVDAAPSAKFREVGQKVPREPARYSGRTAKLAQLTVHEPPPPRDPDAPLDHSMEGFPGQPPASLIPRFWSPGWNSIQALNRFQEEVGGPLRGGDPGVRLLAPAGTAPYFPNPPAPFSPQPGKWLIVPRYSLFGSEELSRLSPGIAARTPAPELTIHPDDAGSLRIAAGERVVLTLGERKLDVPLRISSALPRGVAALTLLTGLRGISLPAWGALAPAEPR
jgi:NADH-quinone oxidoreductase subunit G